MNGMDATFTLRDVIYLGGFIVTVVGFYWKMVMDSKQKDMEIDQLKKDVCKNETIMLKKFTNIHVKMEKNIEYNKSEFDSINKDLNGLKIGISEINGKLDILISK